MQEPQAKLRVFISSTSGALLPYRLAAVEVCHRLGLTPIYMEEFDPQRPTPAEVCRRELESCDIYVLLLAHRYGARLPGQEFSYTELEYQWATSRADMPMLAFVVDPAFPWPPPDIDRGADADALARFTAHVLTNHVKRPLAELATFREDLMLALGHEQQKWAARQPPADEPSATESPKKKRSGALRREARIPIAPAFLAVPPYVGGAPFTGRAADLTTLDDWARSADPVMVVEAIGGTGKSALAWEWAQERAPAAIDGLTGRLWWSLYEGSASMTRFLQVLLAYTSARPMREISQLDRTDLADEALTALRQQPHLIVLDGFERLLAAYHRFDPSKLRDDEVEPNKRSLIEPQAEEIVRRLCSAGPSKILVSTRLMPTALQGRFGKRLPGVRHLWLPGLTDADTRRLLADLDVRGSDAAATGFFNRLGNHPLLIGVVAGLVRDYRAEPGGFDRWLADPTAGGALRLPDLDLSQRQAHILAAALNGLEPGSRRLLGWISVLSGAVSWATLESINPFRPEAPAPVVPDFSYFDEAVDPFNPAGYEEWEKAITERREQAEREAQELLAEWQSSEPVLRATAQLGAPLKDLEDRGLLWWDRASNTYDLHPIIRAYAHDQLEETDRVQANDRIRDHFEALPPEDPAKASSVEDLSQTITIFRALIGAGHLDNASEVWESLKPALLVKVGAYATITELLAPLASNNELVALRMRSDLSIAYGYLGQDEAAIRQDAAIIACVLRGGTPLSTDGAAKWVSVLLGSMAESFRLSGAHISATRCLEHNSAVNAAVGTEQDASLDLAFAVQAATQGQIERAQDFLTRAKALDPPLNNRWFVEGLEIWSLYLAFVAGQSLTPAQIDDAATRASSWLQRRNLAELRCQFFIRNGRYELALAAASERDQLGRNAGLDIAPAVSAFLLAKLGRTDEAAATAEEALLRLNRIDPGRRPYRYLALALRELRQTDEARTYARHAYRQAWADGPPYCHYWDLRATRELLGSIGEPIPDLRATDPATVRIPLDDEIRAFIATLEKKPGTA